ncbi:MAG: OmpA family protein [Cytophagaceae bacterium]|nr:OmpA family protein [Cytophagaceae bacterium]
MKLKFLPLLLAISGLLSGGQALAQSARLKAANRQYDNFSYVNAIRQYEEFLRTGRNVQPAERKEALTRLGYSYRRMQDSRNAERVYTDLIKEFEDVESEAYLYYAQSLAQNGKYRESQKVYSKYGEMQAADLRGKRFTVSYMDMSRFYQDSSSYKVDYLPINSRQADFSPMYYKGGLTFVSAREEGGAIKRIFNWNQTPFLDLYFAPDTAELRRVMEPVSRGGAAIGGSFNSTQVAEAAQEQKPLTKTEIFSRTLNTKYHEGPMTFNKPQDFIVFTRNNYNKSKSDKSSEGINKLKLYSAGLNGRGKWAGVKELPFNSDEYSTGHPAFAPDDSKLYFVSDMPGGFGGTDLYVVEYQNGQWGTPVNMGKEVNTEGNEMFPFIDPNGNLYFASDGHEGLGGLDLFYAEMKEGIVLKGVDNLGAPINSDKDDFGFISTADRSSGYFSSSRKKGVGDDNIYYFRKTCKQLNVIVYDAVTRAPMEGVQLRTVINGENQELRQTAMNGTVGLCLQSGSEYEFKAIQEGYAANSVKYSTRTNSSGHQTSLAIYLQKTNSQLLRGIVRSEYTQQPMAGVEVTLENEKDGSAQKVVTGSDGGYEFDVKPGANHQITAKKDNYATNKNVLSKTKKGPKTIETETGLFGQDEVFKIDNIYYDLNKYFIRPDAAAELNRLVPVLKQNPDMKIEIRAHTDSRSSDVYNVRLSENRARAVVDYLVARGIPPGRLVANGYGESELVNECGDGIKCDETQHQENRRTEFKVVAVRPTSLAEFK